MAENTTEPDPTGIAAWFPVGRQDLPGWRFDVITLLAVIGESSVAVHAQTLTASTLCLLPRIIPAPQALLRPLRPQRLPEVTAKMVGVYGGTVLDTVGFFANIMHPLEELKPYAFRVLEIKHKDLNQVGGLRVGSPGEQGDRKGQGWTSSVDGVRRWFGRRKKTAPLDEAATREKGKGLSIGVGMGLHRRQLRAGGDKRVTFEEGNATTPNHNESRGGNVEMDTIAETPNGEASTSTSTAKEHEGPEPLKLKIQRRQSKISDFLANPTMVNKQERYAVPPASYSPLHIVSILSFLLTIAIFVCAAVWHDGTAMVAIASISAASTITCYASYWRPLLMHRPTTNKVPPGDVVIRTREGAFVLIKCREEVARELYSGAEECQYVSTKYHRVFMGLGMVLLMVSVVLLGNCGWDSQVLIGMSYLFLNGLYWVIGLVPPKYFWDLSRYVMVDVTEKDARDAHLQTSDNPREGAPSFTRTLWYAIRETKHKAWVERSGAMPGTDQWKKWLAEAVDAAWRGERDWPAVTRKNEIMKENLDASSPVSDVVDYAAAEKVGSSTAPAKRQPEAAEQAAPLQEVQPRFLHERTGTF